MLYWVTGSPSLAKLAVDGQTLGEEHVLCRPEEIPPSVLDENVDWQLVADYVDTEAMEAIQNLGMLLHKLKFQI